MRSKRDRFRGPGAERAARIALRGLPGNELELGMHVHAVLRGHHPRGNPEEGHPPGAPVEGERMIRIDHDALFGRRFRRRGHEEEWERRTANTVESSRLDAAAAYRMNLWSRSQSR